MDSGGHQVRQRFGIMRMFYLPAPARALNRGAFCRLRYPMRMLPDGFKWIPRGQYAADELALTVNGRHVAALMKKVDGLTWIARLDCHQPISAPPVMRPCTSFESGKAGIEAWATRHHAALRAGRCVYQQEAEE